MRLVLLVFWRNCAFCSKRIDIIKALYIEIREIPHYYCGPKCHKLHRTMGGS